MKISCRSRLFIVMGALRAIFKMTRHQSSCRPPSALALATMKIPMTTRPHCCCKILPRIWAETRKEGNSMPPHVRSFKLLKNTNTMVLVFLTLHHKTWTYKNPQSPVTLSLNIRFATTGHHHLNGNILPICFQINQGRPFHSSNGSRLSGEDHQV